MDTILVVDDDLANLQGIADVLRSEPECPVRCFPWNRSDMTRDYHGLPVSLASEDPVIVDDWARSASRADYDVGRLGLTVKIVDSDPYYCGVIYQNRVPIASVHCLPNETGLVDGLAQDDITTLESVFQIKTDL